MGNALGGKRRAKVMKIDGSTLKVKPPATAKDILRDNPGFVLLESEQVKLLGLRAKPLQPDQPLKSKKLYFLVELPKMPTADARANAAGTRRIRSGINMSAKDRLESLMLSRRTASDMTFVRAPAGVGAAPGEGEGDGPLRVRLRLPKAQVARLVEESSDPAEAAEKIMELCTGGGGGRRAASGPLPTVAERPAMSSPVNGPIRGKKELRYGSNYMGVQPWEYNLGGTPFKGILPRSTPTVTYL
ncbi:hypothetical protein Taro_017129 [Colocasia esculenta]|uniref:Uncharacterized protein n=1 Tax=Colocasia esculenta TaxID=4460 RepID=A0A843USB1_COLES|nr:hypothetical protein [Colocasia esculenta]